jgi:hypothetical protein
MPIQLISSDYSSLREEVVRLLLDGRARAQQAVEREKAQTYWEIGRLLHSHVLARAWRSGFRRERRTFFLFFQGTGLS